MNIFTAALNLICGVLAVTLTVHSAPAPSGSCQNRSRQSLHEQWSNYQATENAITHESFYLVPEYREHIDSKLNKTREYTVIYLEGNQQCAPSSSAVLPVSQRSHCSWYHVMTYDPARHPDVMVEARTSCTSCLNRRGACEAITYPVPVLRKTGKCDEDGYEEYEHGWHRLVVGYTCVAVPENLS